MGKNRPEPRFENGHFVPAVPVPDTKPILDLNLFDSVKAVAKATRNVLETFNAVQTRIPVSQYMLGGRFFTLLNHPDTIRHCFVKNASNYRMNAIRQKILRPVLREGLITAEGEKWRQSRHALSPMFTPRHVNQFSRGMVTTTAREMPVWFPDKTEVKMADRLSALTYLILSDALFSGDISDDTTKTIADVSTFLTYLGRPDPLDIFGFPDWVPRPTKLRGHGAVRRIRKTMKDTIAARKAGPAEARQAKDDFLGLLLTTQDANGQGLSDDEIEDQLITFIAAGHETTARALCWLFYLLSQDTSSRDRLEAEVDGLDIDNIPPEKWGDHLPFAAACFNEAMRLFPPAPFIVRDTIADDLIGTTYIPKGSVLMVNLWQLHRHETLWQEPAAFNPDRFMGEAGKSIDRFQYLPFGMGPRVCIGQRFAQQEALILIALIARQYRFEYAGSEPPWPVMRITIKPENGMPMRVVRRG